MKPSTFVVVALVAIISSVYGHHEQGHHDPAPAPLPTNDDAESSLASRVSTAMESAEIVPDVVGRAPRQLIQVSRFESFR